MTTITQEKVAQYRSELTGNPDALAALDTIEEWDGDLADAAESIATRNGIEGVEDNADLRWFFAMLLKFVSSPKYVNQKTRTSEKITCLH
jgi:hypothetical protein